MSGEESNFAAEHYVMHAGGNCDGANSFSPPSHERAALANAAALRKVNPTIKNVFYFVGHTEREIGVCSDLDPEWEQHPEWKLHDAQGRVVYAPNNKAYIDCRVPAYQAFWVGHLLNLTRVIDPTTQRPLIDAIYLDGIAPKSYPGIPRKVQREVYAACAAMIGQLQRGLDANNASQLAIINGLDDVDTLPVHAANAGGSMVDHFAILQFSNRTTGQWLPEPLYDLLFGLVRSPINLNRTLQIKTWPGVLVKPMTWANNTQPKTPQGLREMIGQEFNPALALFLLVAEANMWLGYSWFWLLSDYIPFGPDHTTPDNFYPELKCPLGPPLGPPERVTPQGWQFVRQYQHATVKADLSNQHATHVVWHKC